MNQHSMSGTFLANGSTPILWVFDNFESNDGVYLKLYGDFGGGIVTLEEDQGTGTFTAKKCGQFVSDGEQIIRIPNGTKIRMTLAGASSPNLAYYIANMSYRGKYE